MSKKITWKYLYNLIEKDGLDSEDMDILEDIKNTDEFSIWNLPKKRTYTFRLYKDDVDKIKSMAKEEGLPYQTLFSALIHKLANKKIKIDLK